MLDRHIAISGELGSGKTTVARLLCDQLGVEYVGSGDVQRAIAKSMGLSTLQANWLAEEKSSIDEQIDGALKEMEGQGPSRVIDARMAWHFVPSALKVHLLVAPEVGADRLLRGRYSSVEQYHNVEDARSAAEARFQSEQRRFSIKYDVDISRLSNYDLIVDTSDASPESVATAIASWVDSYRLKRVLVSPRRIVPLGDVVPHLSDRPGVSPVVDWDVPQAEAIYVRPNFLLVAGFSEMSAALTEGSALAAVKLVAEGTETFQGDMNALDYAAFSGRRSWVFDWEDAHGFRFSSIPDYIPFS